MVIRGQALTPPELLKAIGMLGEIMPQHLKTLRMPEHPEIVVLDSRNTKVGGDGKFVPIGARDWHTDHAHQERPPNYTALYAVKLPFTRGAYDVVVEVSAPTHDALMGVTTALNASGAFESPDYLEYVNIETISEQAKKVGAAYKPAG